MPAHLLLLNPGKPTRRLKRHKASAAGVKRLIRVLDGKPARRKPRFTKAAIRKARARGHSKAQLSRRIAKNMKRNSKGHFVRLKRRSDKSHLAYTRGMRVNPRRKTSAHKAAKSTKKVARRSAVSKRKTTMAKSRKRRSAAQIRAQKRFVAKFARKHKRKSRAKRRNPGVKRSTKGKYKPSGKKSTIGGMAGHKVKGRSGKRKVYGSSFIGPIPTGHKRRKKRKSAKRVAAARKAARTRKANKAARSAAHRPAKRRHAKRSAGGRFVRKLSGKIAKSTRSIKRSKGKKTTAARLSRRVHKARRSALTLQRYALKHRKGKGKMPKGVRAKMRAYGLGRVNPSFKDVGRGLVELLPEMGAVAVSVAAAAWGGKKLAVELAKFVAPDSKILPWVPTAAVSLLSVAWYAALKMVQSPLSKFAGPVLLGGVAATAVQAMFVKAFVGADGVAMSLNDKMGLPMGEYASIGTWRASLAGWKSGPEGAYMGDYERAMIGEYSSVGSIFSGNSLGAVRQGALPGGREAGHGIDLVGRGGSEETIEDFVDGGSLAGGIF